MGIERAQILEQLWPAYRRVDWLLLGVVGLMMAMGFSHFETATTGTSQSGLLWRQLQFLSIGVGVFLLLQRLDYLTLLRWSPWAYLGCLVLLVAVLFTAKINGARSWFDLYFFNLQPSELMKPVLILALAHYLMYRESYKRFLGLLLPLLLCLVPMALILRQPDMGTAMVLLPLGLAMLFAAGARLWHLLLVLCCGAGGLAGMWFTIMEQPQFRYQKLRVLAWWQPEAYRDSQAWQLLNSQVAIGAGGFWGGEAGPEGVLSGLGRVPEKHTDFIFTVIAAEGGFVAAAALLGLLFLLAIGGLQVAWRTREPAGRLIAVGATAVLVSQAILNIGVAVGLFPTTGVTFPFVSYGGSSLLSSLICLGLLINVGSRRSVSLGRDSFSTSSAG